jgi:hypothetical protein
MSRFTAFFPRKILGSVKTNHQIGSSALTGRKKSAVATFDIPVCSRARSALVATTLDLAQKSVAKPKIVAAIAKLVFLRM